MRKAATLHPPCLAASCRRGLRVAAQARPSSWPTAVPRLRPGRRCGEPDRTCRVGEDEGLSPLGEPPQVAPCRHPLSRAGGQGPLSRAFWRATALRDPADCGRPLPDGPLTLCWWAGDRRATLFLRWSSSLSRGPGTPHRDQRQERPRYDEEKEYDDDELEEEDDDDDDELDDDYDDDYDYDEEDEEYEEEEDEEYEEEEDEEYNYDRFAEEDDDEIDFSEYEDDDEEDGDDAYDDQGNARGKGQLEGKDK